MNVSDLSKYDKNQSVFIFNLYYKNSNKFYITRFSPVEYFRVSERSISICRSLPTSLDVLVSQIEGHLVLIAGKPIGEPVVQRGPFVMCTQVFLNEFKFGFLVLLFSK